MIIEYHRPTTLEEALSLLQRADPLTLPLGGGTVLTQASPQPVAAVDLQALGLDQIQPRGNVVELGAALTLQALIEAAGPGSDAPLALPPALIAAAGGTQLWLSAGVISVTTTLSRLPCAPWVMSTPAVRSPQSLAVGPTLVEVEIATALPLMMRFLMLTVTSLRMSMMAFSSRAFGCGLSGAMMVGIPSNP